MGRGGEEVLVCEGGEGVGEDRERENEEGQEKTVHDIGAVGDREDREMDGTCKARCRFLKLASFWTIEDGGELG